MATAFTQEMADAIEAQTIAIQNLDAFYLLVVGTFVFFMQVSWIWSPLGLACVQRAAQTTACPD
jgi:hypothetical protein